MASPHHTHLLLLLGLAAAAPAARAAETNLWPLWVGQDAAAPASAFTGWQAAGPLIFRQTPADAPHVRTGGLRPLCVRKTDAASAAADTWFLYPLFSHHRTPQGTHWSLFQLVNSHRHPAEHGFDVWPFWYSRQTGSPDTSYRALFPVAGTLKNRLLHDRIHWTLFPLYARFERNHVTTVTAPWPFVRIMSGEGNRGFALWPLFGWREKDGAYRDRFWLWPLAYHTRRELWKPTPTVAAGLLPFYARETSEHHSSESYLLFFGYTDRTGPVRYHETRYFWPLLVQGRGDDRHLNRWAPFYTHSISPKGLDKTWVLWPLWKHTRTPGPVLNQDRTQVLFWLYHSTTQRSATNPAAAPARKTHLWPLFTAWDNGAGRRQIQALSPFAVLCPGNEPVQLAYDPLFALYRYDRRAPGDTRHTFLWNLVSRRRAPDGSADFHLGPLLATERTPATRRISLLCGLLGLKRETPETGWRFFVFEFKRRAVKSTTQPARP